MEPFTTLTSVAAPLPMNNVDTDMIIPKNFLKTIGRTGLGKGLFSEVSRRADGSPDPAFALNQPAYRQAQILVAGDNFGCGSSREHAPQSLIRWGIRAIIASSYAEIFFGNCTALGTPAVTAAPADLEKLAALVEEDPTREITVDVQNKKVTCGDFTCDVDILDSAREALLSGQWDFLNLLLQNEEKIRKTGGEVPYLNNFAV